MRVSGGAVPKGGREVTERTGDCTVDVRPRPMWVSRVSGTLVEVRP